MAKKSRNNYYIPIRKRLLSLYGPSSSIWTHFGVNANILQQIINMAYLIPMTTEQARGPTRVFEHKKCAKFLRKLLIMVM